MELVTISGDGATVGRSDLGARATVGRSGWSCPAWAAGAVRLSGVDPGRHGVRRPGRLVLSPVVISGRADPGQIAGGMASGAGAAGDSVRAGGRSRSASGADPLRAAFGKLGRADPGDGGPGLIYYYIGICSGLVFGSVGRSAGRGGAGAAGGGKFVRVGRSARGGPSWGRWWADLHGAGAGGFFLSSAAAIRAELVRAWWAGGVAGPPVVVWPDRADPGPGPLRACGSRGGSRRSWGRASGGVFAGGRGAIRSRRSGAGFWRAGGLLILPW